ncbi:monofunctional biosynthetic peptidoglycan transglycosylase [Gilliamella sp. wkB178]|nr:monofunctional biosynthetic peptidoglycan transglycosylase [Gilliamella apicola]
MLLSILSILIMRWVNPFGSMLMLERKIVNWNITQQQIWKDWDEISDNIKIAVMASEDQNFPKHWGFDFNAISKALKYNQNNKKTRGASTITQQVAKNIFLWPSRSWVRKGIEAWFTIWIEFIWSKQRILEIYLNYAEWGEGIFGIEAASRYYFHTSAKNLTLNQACLLAAILPNPRNLSPSQPNKYTLNKASWIQGQIINLNKTIYLKKLNTN